MPMMNTGRSESEAPAGARARNCCAAARDHALDEIREPVAVVARVQPPRELVRGAEAGEGLLVVADVVEILAERVAHRQLLGRGGAGVDQRLGAAQPVLVGDGHAAVRGDAGVGHRALRIGREGLREQLPRLLEVATVGHELTEQRERRARWPARAPAPRALPPRPPRAARARAARPPSRAARACARLPGRSALRKRSTASAVRRSCSSAYPRVH